MNDVTAPKEYKLSKRSSYYIFTLLFLLNAIILFAAFSFLGGKAQYIMLLLMGVVASAFSPAAITVTQEVTDYQAAADDVLVRVANGFWTSLDCL